ncbi:hypothetical protein Tco_0431967 [Tanacetum coccineum]
MGDSSITDASLPPEWSKFVTDVKLLKDLHTTNFDQLHAYLKQHELYTNKVRLLRERNQDPLASVANQQMTPPQFNTYQSSYDNPQLQQQFSPSQMVMAGNDGRGPVVVWQIERWRWTSGDGWSEGDDVFGVVWGDDDDMASFGDGGRRRRKKGGKRRWESWTTINALPFRPFELSSKVSIQISDILLRWWRGGGDGGDAMMMIGGVVEGDGGMGMAAAVVAAGDGEWRVAASGVVDRRFETDNSYVAPYDDEESSSSRNMLKMRLKERQIQKYHLNEKQQQSVFCELLLIIFGEEVEKTIETTYTTNLRSMMQSTAGIHDRRLGLL